MKAFLLAAGLGTRLSPLTDCIPKCLIQVAGRPMLDWWFDSLQLAGVTEVLINLHHLPEKVIRHTQSLTTDIKIKFVFEPVLIGSAGTILQNRDFIIAEKSFFVLYADNLTSLILSDLKKYHDERQHPVTMAVFKSLNPSACGIVQLDTSGTVTNFVEKPDNPTSDLANAGIYIFEPAILNILQGCSLPVDIGFDLLPKLIGQINAYIMRDYLIDIGTHANLAAAELEWPRILEGRR